MKYSNGKFSELWYRNKVKLFLPCEVVSPNIHIQGTGWKGVEIFTPRRFVPRKEHQYHLNGKLSGFEIRSGRFGEDILRASLFRNRSCRQNNFCAFAKTVLSIHTSYLKVSNLNNTNRKLTTEAYILLLYMAVVCCIYSQPVSCLHLPAE
jgi:hypothetical protein